MSQIPASKRNRSMFQTPSFWVLVHLLKGAVNLGCRWCPDSMDLFGPGILIGAKVGNQEISLLCFFIDLCCSLQIGFWCSKTGPSSCYIRCTKHLSYWKSCLFDTSRLVFKVVQTGTKAGPRSSQEGQELKRQNSSHQLGGTFRKIWTHSVKVKIHTETCF